MTWRIGLIILLGVALGVAVGLSRVQVTVIHYTPVNVSGVTIGDISPAIGQP